MLAIVLKGWNGTNGEVLVILFGCKSEMKNGEISNIGSNYPLTKNNKYISLEF